MTSRSDVPTPELPPLWARIVKYGIVVVTAIFYVTVALQFDYTPDASYVSFRAASSLVETGHFAFGRNQPTAGTAGPVWTMILAAGIVGGLDAPLVAKTFDLVFACLALFGVYFLAALILRDKVAAFFAALLFSVDAWVLRSSASGMGDSFALVVTVAVLWYGFRREYLLASFLSGVLIVTAPLEGMLLWTVTMIDASAMWRRHHRVWRQFVGATSMALVTVGPWLIVTVLNSMPAFGPLPIASFIGTPSDGPAGEQAAQVLFWHGVSAGLLIVVLIAGHAVAAKRSDWRLLAPSSFPLVWAGVVMLVRLLHSPSALAHTWVLIAPVVVIYGILGLYYLSLFMIGVGRKSLVALLTLVVAVLCVNQLVYRLKLVPEMNRTVLEMQQEVRPMAHWLKSRVRPDEILAVPFGGLIGWITGAEIRTSPLLWVVDDRPDPRASRDSADVESYLGLKGNVAAVVDRSPSTARLESLDLEPVRTWGQGGGFAAITRVSYTVYVDPVRRTFFLGGQNTPSEGEDPR